MPTSDLNPPRKDYDPRAGEYVGKPRVFRMITPAPDPYTMLHGEPAIKPRDVDKGGAYRVVTRQAQTHAQTKAIQAQDQDENWLSRQGYYQMNPFEQLEFWMLRKESMRTQENIDILARYYASKGFWEKEYYPQYAGVYDPIQYDPKTQKLWTVTETDQGIKAIIVPKEYTGLKQPQALSLTEQFLAWIPNTAPLDPLDRMLFEKTGYKRSNPAFEVIKAIAVAPLAIGEQVGNLVFGTPAPPSGSGLIAQTILGNKQAEAILKQYPAYAVTNWLAEAVTLTVLTHGTQIAGSYAIRGADVLAGKIKDFAISTGKELLTDAETRSLEQATGLTPTRSYYVGRVLGMQELQTPELIARSTLVGDVSRSLKYVAWNLPSINLSMPKIPIISEAYSYGKSVWMPDLEKPTILKEFDWLSGMEKLPKATPQTELSRVWKTPMNTWAMSYARTALLSKSVELEQEISQARFDQWFALPAPTLTIQKQKEAQTQIRTERAFTNPMLEMLPSAYQDQMPRAKGETMMQQWLGVAYPFMTGMTGARYRVRDVESEVQSYRLPTDALTLERGLTLVIHPVAIVGVSPELGAIVDLSPLSESAQRQTARVTQKQTQEQAQKLFQQSEALTDNSLHALRRFDKRKGKKGKAQYLGWQTVYYPMRTAKQLLRGMKQ